MTNQTPQPSQSAISPERAREILWRRGEISFLMDRNQRELYKIYRSTKNKIIVWNCCRGMGKSFVLSAIAIEECIRTANTIVGYGCPTQTMARETVYPLFRQILENCPEDLKPEYKTQEHAYKFPNGSIIYLSGLDGGRAENFRGKSALLMIIDEAAKVKANQISGDLKDMVHSIFLPAVTRTKAIDGKIIIASTPPKDVNHPFVHFVSLARLEKTLSTKVIYECPRYTGEMINQLKRTMTEEAFRREYMCEIIRGGSLSIVPEFTRELQEKIVMPWKKPPFYHGYVSMDIGMRDLTVVLFAYYDFRAAKIIIEDEVVLNADSNDGKGFNTKILADSIKEKEHNIFVNPITQEFTKPYKRVSDNNLIVIKDMYDLHGLYFEATKKDDADAALNNMKLMLIAERIIINPKCETLIRHLEEGVWNTNKTEFARSVDNGHYDAVDALSYLVRNINFNANPYPVGYGTPMGEGYYTYRKNNPYSNTQAIKKMLNIKQK